MRPSEWLLTVYFLYAAVISLTLPLNPPIPVITATLNLCIIAAYGLLAWADSFRRRLPLGIIRDWFPLVLMLLAYREMGWFAIPQEHHTLEQTWVAWDRFVLNKMGARAAIEALGPLIPSVLEISYSLVYALAPFSVAFLYILSRRDRVSTFLTVFVLGVLLCYVQFPFWPSEPPRTIFPGQDSPSFDTIFRRFNWWMLGGYGIHTSVFPSAHVAGSFSAYFGMMRALPEKPWAGRVLLVMAILIATATVYGRYHYLADAGAGLAMALIALGVSRGANRHRLEPKP